MKAREALVVFERALETGFCVSLRGFAECVGVVPSTIVNWKNNPEKELRGIEATKVQYVREEVEKFEPEFVDWQAFRREAAKDILCSLLSRVERIYTCVKSDGARVTDHRDFIRIAIEDADELIEQLKEEKK